VRPPPGGRTPRRSLARAGRREGGSFRISLTYDAPTGTGKTSAQTDTFHGRFVKLVPDEQVVNETGWRMSLAKLAALAEAGSPAGV
jgi:hypothetical protein